MEKFKLNKTIYLVDAYAHIYRGYHAVRGLSTKAGQPTNAIYAMGKFLVNLEKEISPEFGVFVFDKGKSKDRIAIHPEYKANRPPMPDDMRSQIEIIRSMILASGWRIIEKEGYEADDLMGTIAHKFKDYKIQIISNDKDMAQVVNDRVSMLVTTPRVKGFTTRGVEEVNTKFEVKPEQIIDYLALIGDSSDNIPGVAGIGPKTAAKLLSQFGTIENMILNCSEIVNLKIRDKIEKSDELLKMNKKLISLDLNISIDKIQTVNDLLINSADIDKLIDMADQYELKSLVLSFKKDFKTQGTPDLFSF
jgi:DNA polymerase I